MGASSSKRSAASSLPLWPRILFTILEPISLLAGVLATTIDPAAFAISMHPTAPTPQAGFSLSLIDRLLTYQMGNLFGLLGLVGLVVFYSSTEPEVMNKYLVICAIGDLGHLASILAVVGYKDFADVHHWNAQAWGSVGFTVVLLVSRILYLTGCIGTGKDAGEQTKRA